MDGVNVVVSLHILLQESEIVRMGFQCVDGSLRETLGELNGGEADVCSGIDDDSGCVRIREGVVIPKKGVFVDVNVRRTGAESEGRAIGAARDRDERIARAKSVGDGKSETRERAQVFQVTSEEEAPGDGLLDP